MNEPLHPIRIAGAREAGARCPLCQGAVALDAEIVLCPDCSAVHHAACFQAAGQRCGSFDCAPSRREIEINRSPDIRISADEIEKAPPPPTRPAARYGFVPAPPPARPTRSRWAIASFVVGLAGIPLFGMVTGLVAIVLGSIALGAIQRQETRGTAWAISGLLLGIVDMVGWTIFLVMALSPVGERGGLRISELEPDNSALENLQPHLLRPMMANVLIENRGLGVLGGTGIGSGVILKLENHKATIVTNRHVIDAAYAAEHGRDDGRLPDATGLYVKLVGQPAVEGRLLWVAPDGIDLALLSAPAFSDRAKTVECHRPEPLTAGEDVFSIGNPQHLDWTYCRGVISQFRQIACGSRKVRLIQTDTAINPGNSGGGLYDKTGRLIGINTLTSDKRFTEGISFAVAFETLLQLKPPPLDEDYVDPFDR